VPIVMLSISWNIRWIQKTNHRSRINNHSAINVNVDSMPPILVIRFPMDSFIISVLLSDNFTIISYGPFTLLTSVTQGSLLS
jgi:hypothetical protein